MLILARDVGERIIVNNNVKIIILSIRENQVRLGFEAPKSVSVYREEIYRPLIANKDNETIRNIKQLKQYY